LAEPDRTKTLEDVETTFLDALRKLGLPVVDGLLSEAKLARQYRAVLDQGIAGTAERARDQGLAASRILDSWGKEVKESQSLLAMLGETIFGKGISLGTVLLFVGLAGALVLGGAWAWGRARRLTRGVEPRRLPAPRRSPRRRRRRR
jgi:hypothetical protein